MAYLGRVKPTETTSSVLRSTYTGNGSTTTYALPGPVANETSIIATINGVTQQDAAYSTDGTNIIFAAAPASGDAIELRTLSAVAMSYAPSAGSVVTGVIADGAITAQKLASGVAVANIGARAITAAQVPAGSVLQVVQATTDTQQSTTSTSFVDVTGLSASITPTSSTNKILIRYRVSGSNGNASNMNAFQILRDSTAVGNGAQGVSRVKCHSVVRGQYSDANPWWTTAGEYLDSPATTSAITYKIQYKVDSGTCYVNRDPSNGDSGNYPSPLSEITLMEIAA